MNDVLMKVKSIVADELDNMPENGQMSYDCIELTDKLIDIWKKCCEIEEKEMTVSSYNEGYSRSNGGYSQRGYGNNRMMPRYYEGNSYGGSRMGSRNYSDGGYSHDDARHDIVEKLENLMSETRDDRDREAIRRMLDGMR